MRKLVMVLLVLCLISGCALVTKFNEMSTKQRVMWILRSYNAEYIVLAHNAAFYSVMSPEKQKLLRWRKMILKEIYPLVKQMVEDLENGIEPTQTAEDIIVDLLNRLMAADPLDIDQNAPPEDEPPEEAENPQA